MRVEMAWLTAVEYELSLASKSSAVSIAPSILSSNSIDDRSAELEVPLVPFIGDNRCESLLWFCEGDQDC